MEIYLVQHGAAVPAERDATRPLSAQGRWEVTRMAEVVRRAGVSIQTICHSGKPRAEQTAAIFAGALEPCEGVRQLPGLAPQDDPERVGRALGDMSGSVMLVGHLPHLSRLAGVLLTNDATRELVAFRQAGIVCLATGNDGRWRVRWYLIPELIGP